jgi:hypothetical protein
MDDVKNRFSRSLRFVQAVGPLYIVDVVRLLGMRFDFVRLPVTADELVPREPTTPVTFSHGKLGHDGRTIVIDTLSVFPTAISVDTRVSTDDADVVIDNILALTESVIRENEGRERVYINHMEFRTDVGLEYPYAPAAQIAPSLARLVAEYSAVRPDLLPQFHLTAVVVQTDPMQYVLPCDFRIERRAGQPFSGNVYFSQAPLKTSDHRTILEEYERSARAR